MKLNHFFVLLTILLLSACSGSQKEPREVWAEDILGRQEYQAISFGGYREETREQVPSVEDLKEDMRILSAMGVKIIRTYNTQQFDQAANLLKAIRSLKSEDPDFEMYVMLGAWIDCDGAWGDEPDHHSESVENNTAEINAAVEMANTYPDIVKIIAVGNEAMVHWAGSYFVYPETILKWVIHLQELKKSGKLPEKLWVTSSDNFASWGGEDKSYHTEALTELINAVDYISMHTYPFHDTHYHSDFWIVPESDTALSKIEKIEAAMLRAGQYAENQYKKVEEYVAGLGIEKPIHIGETGWASVASKLYDAKGSAAADEYKQKLYYQHMREWTNKADISCFYFEAFDEKWKDGSDENGPENHFGLINLKGEAKYAIWDLVDQGIFEGLSRNGFKISKSFDGNEPSLIAGISEPPLSGDLALFMISTINEKRKVGEVVTEGKYIIRHQDLKPDGSNAMTYPSEPLKLNAWEGTCAIEMSSDGVISIQTAKNGWWGCGLEIQGDGKGEDLSVFGSGTMHFEIKGNTESRFELGFQTGIFANGDQTNNLVNFGPDLPFSIKKDWQKISVPVSKMNKGAKLKDVTSLLYLRGEKESDGKEIFLRNLFFEKG